VYYEKKKLTTIKCHIRKKLEREHINEKSVQTFNKSEIYDIIRSLFKTVKIHSLVNINTLYLNLLFIKFYC